jgi:hypothetical protein
MYISLHRVVRGSAWLACVCVVAMIAVFFATGVGQDALQFVRPASDYARILLQDPTALRVTLGFDNLFIVFYTTAFVALAVVIVREGASRPLVFVALGFLVTVALLDMIENFHFMVMLARAEAGLLPSDGEIGAQVFESLLKFHISYVGLFMVGCALPRRDRIERTLANLSMLVQLPVGILIYQTPRAIAVPLVFARFAYFLTALALVGLAFGKETRASTD